MSPLGAPTTSTDPGGGGRMVAIAFSDVPGWAEDDHLAAFQTFLKSCPAVLRQAAAPGRAALARAATAALAAAGEVADRAAARAFFESQFVAHRMVPSTSDPGLLTGYYEPELAGALSRSAAFPVPLHARPPELINLMSEAERAVGDGRLTHARRTAHGIEPYYTREEIECGALDGRGLELCYLADPVDTFFLHVQGSGVVRLADGRWIRVSYDGKNGHPYSSVGRYLIETGQLAAEGMSLDAMAAWLKADPERGRRALWHNRSYVFFRFLADDIEGPLGVEDIPLTPGRSLAVDTAWHALGTPIFLIAPTVRHAGCEEAVHAGRGAGVERLMIAQDVGSAIRGPERGDFFFGTGAVAGAGAGITKDACRFIPLLAREDAPAAGAGEGRP